jgi:hypothetical protein
MPYQEIFYLITEIKHVSTNSEYVWCENMQKISLTVFDELLTSILETKTTYISPLIIIKFIQKSRNIYNVHINKSVICESQIWANQVRDAADENAKLYICYIIAINSINRSSHKHDLE